MLATQVDMCLGPAPDLPRRTPIPHLVPRACILSSRLAHGLSKGTDRVRISTGWKEAGDACRQGYCEGFRILREEVVSEEVWQQFIGRKLWR